MIRRLLAFFIFLISCSLSLAGSSGPSGIESLGFRVTAETARDGKKIRTYTDLGSNYVLRADYSSSGELELLEEFKSQKKSAERILDRKLARACEAAPNPIPSQKPLSSSEDSLRTMAQGLRCLAGKDPWAGELGPRARMIAASIDALFASRGTAWEKDRCSLVNRVTKPTRTLASSLSPVPLADPPPSPFSGPGAGPGGAAPGAAFHRMMHGLGYQHFASEADVITLSEACCFEKSREACDLLRTSDPGLPHAQELSAGNAEYLRKLTVILFAGAHSDLAFRTAWAALSSYGNLKDEDVEGNLRVNSQGLYSAMFAAPPEQKTLLRMIYAEAAAGNLPDQNYDKAIAKFQRAVTDKVYQQGDLRRDFARHLGAALAGAINGDPELTADALEKFDKVRDSTCRMLASDTRSGELEQIKTMAAHMESWDYWRNHVPKATKCRLRNPCAAAASCFEAPPNTDAPKRRSY